MDKIDTTTIEGFKKHLKTISDARLADALEAFELFHDGSDRITERQNAAKAELDSRIEYLTPVKG